MWSWSLRFQEFPSVRRPPRQNLLWACSLPILAIGRRKMRRVLCAVLMLATLLFVYGEARTEPLRIGEVLRHENVLLPHGRQTEASW
jgi:hypothetical protein